MQEKPPFMDDKGTPHWITSKVEQQKADQAASDKRFERRAIAACVGFAGLVAAVFVFAEGPTGAHRFSTFQEATDNMCSAKLGRPVVKFFGKDCSAFVEPK